MDGILAVHGDGPGKGTVVTRELPIDVAEKDL